MNIEQIAATILILIYQHQKSDATESDYESTRGIEQAAAIML